jgi:hypothetical protein
MFITTQGELLLDLRLVEDPNNLFYGGDTAQTISRGVGFRFEDVRSMFFEEEARRRQLTGAHSSQSSAAAGGGTLAFHGRPAPRAIECPPLLHLSLNFRTHQGVMQVAATLTDMIVRYFPNTVDKLERETALFQGPPPVLVKSTDLGSLSVQLGSASGRRGTQIEFG